MNIQISKNKYWNAACILMLFSAAIHMVILFLIALISKSFYVVNYFNIISISYFIPNFLNSFWGNVVSVAFAVILYVIFLRTNKTK
jgi:hypothetical protein